MTLVTTSALTALAAVLLAYAWQARRGSGGAVPGPAAALFLVSWGAVLDANRRGTALLDTLRDGAGAAALVSAQDRQAAGWTALVGFLHPIFPELPARLEALLRGEEGATGDEVLTAGDDSGRRLRILARGDGVVRLGLTESGGPGAEPIEPDAVLVDRLGWQALRDENALLQRNVDLAPTPVWRIDAAGGIVWANAAYMRLVRESCPGAPVSWPLPVLFPAVAPGAKLRHALQAEQRGRQQWFDLVACRDGDALLVHALPADDAQKAERTRREFVQTLTRTFATLPIGLAVFDRTRRLHLFNPALTDLTRLEPEFLASRPGLDGFLNRMRDKRILPEPRDYKAWSRRLLDVEAALSGAGFEETWSLPDGRNFRVSVAPHPDGALALLIEDVTDDIRLKRNFRAELETGQAALDMAENAIAVFAASGDLVVTNAAFDDLWALDDAGTLGGIRLSEAIGTWRELGEDAGFWDRVLTMSRPGSGLSEATGAIRFDDGEQMAVRARPCAGGGVIVSFLSQDSGATPRRSRVSGRPPETAPETVHAPAPVFASVTLPASTPARDPAHGHSSERRDERTAERLRHQATA